MMGWGYMYGPGYGGYGFGLGWIFMAIFWIVVVALIVGLIYWAVRGGDSSYHRETPSPEKENSAMKILKERYARGDISKDEFETKKRDLAAK